MTGPAARDDRSDAQDSAPAEGVPQVQPHHMLGRTRMGTVWVAAGSFAVVLVLLLIFILENSRTVQISYLGAHGHLPLGVALLLAAVLGMLLVIIPGTARIIQLRILARRHHATGAAPARHAPEAVATASGRPGRN
jgi:uncharacterized integral membrane protein